MKNRIAIWIIVALVVATNAAPVLGAGIEGDRAVGPLDKPFFTLVGIVAEKGADYIDVDVYHGNRFAQPHLGQKLRVWVHDTTEYRRWTPSGCVPASFDDVDKDDTISIHGMVLDDAFVGDRVTVDVPLDCCTP